MNISALHGRKETIGRHVQPRWRAELRTCTTALGWQPIHVQDFAALALQEAESREDHLIVNATGPETYTFRELWCVLARGMGLWRPVLPVPAWFGLPAARVLGSIVGDVMLTRDEIAGLSQDRLAVDCPPAGRRSLRGWVARHAGTLGKTYASELSRRALLPSK